MPGRNSVRAFLGLGGNIGDPAVAMGAALRRLDDHPSVTIAAVSSLYRTPPWGRTDQPDFLNAVAAVDTVLTARELLDLCLETEHALKRVRAERWGPRLIDMDILIYGDAVIDEEGLQVPHPRMLERAFVLAPLADVAPNLDLAGQSPSQRLARVPHDGIARLRGAEWWRDG